MRFSLPEMRVTGIAGPLNGPGWWETDLEAIHYDEDPERLTWANEKLQDFDLHG
jgi:hypothetical protein